MLRFLLVDNHVICRLGMRQVLTDHFKAIIVGEAADARDGLRQMRDAPWDVVILELSLPDRDGLRTLQEALAYRPDLRAVVASGRPVSHFARRALDAGAYGYFSKHDGPDTFLSTVMTVHGGQRTLLPPDLDGARLAHETLSARESQVLCLLGAGMTVSQISGSLGLSAKTVATFRSRLLVKLGLSSTPQLIRYAIEHGLVNEPREPEVRE